MIPRGGFSRPLQWMQRALLLDDPVTPQVLHMPEVIGVVDVTQQGAALATYRNLLFTRAASTATGVETLIAADSTVTRLIVACGGIHNGGAGAATLVFFIQDPQVTSGISIRRISAGVGVPFGTIQGDPTGWPGFYGQGSTGMQIIPPGWDLRMQWPTTAAGEDWLVQMCVMEVPAGFRPW